MRFLRIFPINPSNALTNKHDIVPILRAYLKILSYARNQVVPKVFIAHEQEIIYAFAPDPTAFWNEQIIELDDYLNYSLAGNMAKGLHDLISYSNHRGGVGKTLLDPLDANDLARPPAEADWLLDGMGMLGMGGNAYHALSELSVGSSVDGSLSTNFQGQPFGFLVREGVVAPGWNSGSSGYAGFEFTYDGAPAYGWMKINYSGTSFTVEEWAFESTGAAIEVGAIPEPGTALLLGVGLAGAALAGRRTRKFVAERVDGGTGRRS